ncbi:helix-hairpin-helix domain-containing protein [Archangium violaceum]|uniref:helix-hairpin-helix domain-containing protein n=1 Tax=Archangium violaceum TaxID=83451 RepID=UPI00193B6A71|nr:helix-hairpin-helix domain-containing protein [Archangium violaceum]QRK12551.1 helix-hairpin-helix domain-containing protein [Archangium violaceum]
MNLNSADVEELKLIEGIDSARARLILEHRERHGRFQSWEEVEQIPGIGPVLMEKVRAVASLGDGAEGAEPVVPTAALEEVEVLTTLARLDLEAALAYEACAEVVEIADIREHLLQFRDDHLRHVDAINRVLETRGGKAIEPRSSGQLLRGIARVASSLGSDTGLIALLTNEELTNETYEMVAVLDWDSDIEQMLERHAADEMRHFEWLSGQVGEFEEEAPEQPAAPV